MHDNPPPLRPYQSEGVGWLTREANRLLVDDPGLGKTATAIRAAAELGAEHVLTVCPAVARPMWQLELAFWWPRGNTPPDCLVIQPGVDANITPVPRPGWVVVAYSTLSRVEDPWIRVLAALSWDVLILDECQYLRGETLRTRAVYGRRLDRSPGTLAHNAKRVWLLSGTPAPNHAGELYSHIRTLFPDVLPSHVRNEIQFQDRYCKVRDTVQGRRLYGSNVATIPELRSRLRPHVLRHRREDVAQDLPPLDFHDTPLALTDVAIASANALARDTKASRWIRDVAQLEDDDALIDALRNDEVLLAHMRHKLGQLKVLPAVEFCEDLLNQMAVHRRKLVVFAYHRDVINLLVTGLTDWNPVVVEGATAPLERQHAIRRFQEHRHVGAFIGQIQAGGVAITLTAATTAVFVECSWTPSDNYQAALRIHRLGQVNPCTVHFLYVPGSLDVRIMQVFRRKAQELAKLLNREKTQ